MRNEKILVVDDDPAVRRLIWKALQSTGILIYQSDSIEKTMDIISRVNMNLFILDINLEHENDGYYLSQMIREQNPITPIIFLSGKNSEPEIVTGLEMGADIYLTKPFSPAILKAQVLATINRSKNVLENINATENSVLTVGDFRFDRSRFQLYKKEQIIALSSKEVQLMQFFLENPEQVFSKEQIYSNVWGKGEVDANTIMVFMNHLRNKLEDEPKNPQYLRTVWGIGYMFLPTGQS